MTSKNTHTVIQIEELMFEYTDRIKNAKTKGEKTELLKELKRLERHWNDTTDKIINGKKYPVKKKVIDVSKKELLALIESGTDWEGRMVTLTDKIALESGEQLDYSGISPGSTRFTYID